MTVVLSYARFPVPERWIVTADDAQHGINSYILLSELS